MNVAKHLSTECDRRGNIGKAALHQHHVCRINGDIRACPDGNADIRSGQRGCIVDAVTHHDDLALLLHLADDRLFSIGHHACDDLIHACRASDGVRRFFVVTRQHDDVKTHLMHRSDRLGTILLQGVCHRDHTEIYAVFREEKRCFSLLREAFCFCGRICGKHGFC